MSRAASSGESKHYLNGLALFADLSAPALIELAQASRIKRVPKGTYIFLQTDPAEAAYVVRSGSIAIVLSSIDGRELVINEMRAGDIFGELSLLLGRSRSTGAMARVDSEVIVLPREAFLNTLANELPMALSLLETTARRLYVSSERESALAFLDAQTRLARILLDLDKIEEAKGYVTISQEELAQRIGLTRQTVAKILGKWRRAGWLITGRGRIMVLDRKALARIKTLADA
jgi:CRP-like cAMP-binding protein